MNPPCRCDDETSLCPLHTRPPDAITVEDIMAGCDCHLMDLLGDGFVTVVVSVTCPVHGAKAFRKES